MKKFLVIVLIWVLILGAGAYALKLFVLDKEGATSSSKVVIDSKPHEIHLALDSFSGYCIFRSPDFKKRLAKSNINFEYVDDKADYKSRMQKVQSGETPLAVFTIDALLANSPATGEPPATIVMVIDETRGADAMVSYKKGLKDVNALNSPTAKVVLTEGSPSETLFRIVRNRFDLSRLPSDKKKYIIGANPKKGAEDVYDQFFKAKDNPTEHKAYVLWEPYVSLALQCPDAQVLVDSSQFQGYIVDVLVTQPSFLHEHPVQVEAVVKTYLEMLHETQASSAGMAKLVLEDASLIGEKKINTLEIATKVANGIWWKNTMENYDHFGLLRADRSNKLPTISNMIQRITLLLNQTKEKDESSLRAEPPAEFVNSDILQKLQDQHFQLDEKFSDAGTAPADEEVEWATLEKVGSFRVKSLSFSATSPDELTNSSKELLDDLAEELRLWPNYYLRIEGNTLEGGEPEANKLLAEKRAQAVRDYLVDQKDIKPSRLMSVAMEPGQGREVRFVALRRPKQP